MLKTKSAVFSFLLLFVAAVVVSSCAPHYKKQPTPGPSAGPPPWAPAHGKRAKYTYRYYPSTHVYFNIERGIYYYRSGDTWVDTYTLPTTIIVNRDNYIILKMDVDRPYAFHGDVVKKYPPGWKKKKQKKKRKKYSY